MSPDSLRNVKPCAGLRPWLYNGRHRRQIGESCDRPLQGVQKAASNVYLPVIRNSIFIPKQDNLPPSISAFMNNEVYVNTARSVSDRAMAITVIKSLSMLGDEHANLIYDLVNNSDPSDDLDYNDIKGVEYKAFKRGSIKKDQDFNCSPQNMTQY
ncbi:MAG: hypothetical protein EOO38_29160, partial [Cytophagaceae bacterium]